MEIRRVKAILVRSEMEMRDTLLETGGKATLVIKWPSTWLNCLCPSALCKVELVNDETARLAEKISKQSVEGVACFLLLLVVKCEKKEVI